MFSLLLFISVPPLFVNGLICIVPTSHIILADKFVFDHFNTILFSLETINHDNNEPCRLQLFFMEQSNEMAIRFDKEFAPSVDLFSDETYLETLMNFDQLEQGEEQQEKIRFYKILEHSCSEQDYCDQLFVFRTIQAFIKQNNNQQLHQQLMPLLMKKNTKQVSCLIDGGKSKICPDNLCVAVYWTSTKQFEFRCLSRFENGIKIYIKNYFLPVSLGYNQQRITEFNNIQMIQYMCNYNHCNNLTIGYQVVQIVERYYDISSIKDLFNLHNQQTTKQQLSTDMEFKTSFFTSTPSSSNLATDLRNDSSIQKFFISSSLSTDTDDLSSNSRTFPINEDTSISNDSSIHTFFISSSLSTDMNDLSSNSPTFPINENTSISNDLTSTYTISRKNEVASQFELIRIDLIICLIGYLYYNDN